MAGAFLLGVALTGPAWWVQSYADLAITRWTVLAGLLLQSLLVLALVGGGRVRTGTAFAWQLPCFAAAVALRAAVETARDPTSHNLWPLEVGAALALGAAFITPACAAAAWFRRQAGRR